MHSIGIKHLPWTHSSFFSGNFNALDHRAFTSKSPPCGYEFYIRAFARRKLAKRSRKNDQKSRKDESVALNTVTETAVREDSVVSDAENEANNVAIASRSDVLQACTVTSGLIAALGVLIRQGSHIASIEGAPIIDCSAQVSFDIEIWHLGLIMGLVVLVSSCRYLLLATWPDFAESTEAANQQVLTALEPLDYIVVSFLPGISEELLFRGGLLPLLGMDYKSVLVVAAVFGVLHLGGGRKYSFAIWATFVGFVYGYATILSSSLTVPMASHAINNLVGGILWRQTSKSLN